MKKILILLGVLISFGAMAQTPAVIYADSVFVKDSEGNSTKVYSVGDNASEADMVNQLDTVLIPQTRWTNNSVAISKTFGDSSIVSTNISFGQYENVATLTNSRILGAAIACYGDKYITHVSIYQGESTPVYTADATKYNGIAIYEFSNTGDPLLITYTTNEGDYLKTAGWLTLELNDTVNVVNKILFGVVYWNASTVATAPSLQYSKVRNYDYTVGNDFMTHFFKSSYVTSGTSPTSSIDLSNMNELESQYDFILYDKR